MSPSLKLLKGECRIAYSLTQTLQLKPYWAAMPESGPRPDSDPKSETEISLKESPFEDRRDEALSSEFFDFLRGLAPLGGISCDAVSLPWLDPWPDPWFDPRRCRRCREPPVEDSWLEESAVGSDDRWWRRVVLCFVPFDSDSDEWCRDFGSRCRDFVPFDFCDESFSPSLAFPDGGSFPPLYSVIQLGAFADGSSDPICATCFTSVGNPI